MISRRFFQRDGRNGPERFLEWRVRLFVVGAGLALGGMMLEIGWLVTAAVVVLLAGIAIRFISLDTPDQDPP